MNMSSNLGSSPNISAFVQKSLYRPVRGYMRLRLPDFEKVVRFVSPTFRPPLTPRKYFW